jgi:hypothetical protein
MSRSAVSKADQALIAEVAAHGVSISATKLERWRSVGLMPKPAVAHLGARGTSTTYLPEAVEIAAAIGRLSRRGLPFRTVAVSLFFEGYPVPDELLTAGFRTLVRQFAANFAIIRAQLRPDVPDDGDLLADAEVIATWAIAENGWSVRRMRRNLRANPPPDVTPANREAVLEGVLASMVRFAIGELPESDDSLKEVVAAIGAQGAFEKATWAETPLVSEAVGDLREVLASSSLDMIVSLVDRVSAADLRHARAIFVPVMGLLQIPEPVRYYFGTPGDALKFPLNTQMLAVIFMAGMLMWLSVDAEPEGLYDVLARNGRATDDEVATAKSSMQTIRSRRPSLIGLPQDDRSRSVYNAWDRRV